MGGCHHDEPTKVFLIAETSSPLSSVGYWMWKSKQGMGRNLQITVMTYGNLLRLMPGHGLDPLDGTHRLIGRTQVMPPWCQGAAIIRAHSTVTSPGSASLPSSSFPGRRFPRTPACDSGRLAPFGSLILYIRRLSSKSVAPVQSSYLTRR